MLAGSNIRGSDLRAWRREVMGFGLWAMLFAVVVVWGRRLRAAGANQQLSAVPLYGQWHIRVTVWEIPAAAFALAVVFTAPALVRRMQWTQLLGATAFGTALWAVLLARVDGPGGLTDPLLGNSQYMPFLPRITNVGQFLSSYVRRLPTYPIHIRGHPPGMLLVLDGLRRTGFAGPGWAAALIIGAYAVGVVALLITVRSLAGERPARLAAPFIAFAPAAITVATTGDALFGGVALTGIALFTAATQRNDRRGDLLALLAGITLGAALFLSYGLTVLAVPVIAIAALRRRVRPTIITAVGVAAVAVAFLAAGFWWVDGLRATAEQYRLSVAKTRPYGYFLVADLAVFGLIAGPATVAALTRLGRQSSERARWWIVPALGLTMVALADLSGYSKAEVERIWLFLVPPVAAATALLGRPGTNAIRRGWLGLQLIAGLALQAALRTPW